MEPNIIVGKNAADNWNIIKQSHPEFWWFHLNKYPSAHVILQDKCVKPQKSLLIKCAKLCKENSKLRDSNQKISVIYSKIKNVRLGKNVGEVVTKNKIFMLKI
jgi:predicted ribosome quality control (RQC) complex YloA/Tae2 family protein